MLKKRLEPLYPSLKGCRGSCLFAYILLEFQSEGRNKILLLRWSLYPGNDGAGGVCKECYRSQGSRERLRRAALAELGMETSIDHVTDFSQIAAYGVMSTPALVVDGKVVSYGNVLRKDEAVAIIQKVRG